MTAPLGALEPGAPNDATGRTSDGIIARLERLPVSRFHVHLGAVLGVGTFFDAFDSGAIAVALSVIFSSLHIGFVNGGLLISSALAGQFIGAIVIGYATELIGRRWAFIVSLAVFGAMSLASAFAWDFQSLVVMRFLEGLGLGAEVPIAVALFNEYVRGTNRGLVASVYQSIFTWGLFLTPLVGALTIGIFGPDLGWRALFALGAFPLLVAVYAVFRLPESARWLVARGRLQQADKLVSSIERAYDVARLAPLEIRYRADTQRTRFGELFSPQYRQRTALTWVQFFTTFFVTGGLFGWLPTIYVQVGGLPADRALLLTAATTFGTVIGGYSFVWLADRVGRKPLFLAGFAVAALGAAFGAVAAGLLHATSWPVLFAAGLIIAVGASINNLGVYVYTAELYPTRMRGWATAAGSSMSRVAGVLAPTAVGLVLAANLGIVGVFTAFCVAGVIGLVVMGVWGVETRRRVLEELST